VVFQALLHAIGVTGLSYRGSMTEMPGQAGDRYIYRSASSSTRHRQRVSAYLVEYLRESKVVARIEPLGLVHESLGEHELVLHGLRRNLVLSGRWSQTPSQHHDRVRVTAPRAITR
jgi:hypothetical protein